MFNPNEIAAWESKLHRKHVSRLFKTHKGSFDPRREKWNDYRHHRLTKCWYRHESKYIRSMTQRNFRRKMKCRIGHEANYRPIPHDYRTYGRMTW